MNEPSYAQLTVGDSESFLVTVTPELVSDFAKLSGDTNPLHVDPIYAATTSFEKPIAHGMLVGALFSRLIGIHLPGKHALYLSQTLKFLSPIIIGNQISIHGKIIQKTDAHRTLTILTTATDTATRKLLVSGEALVQVIA
jgi:acyl dehydratase